MCLVPPIAIYENIIEDSKVPQVLRDAASNQLAQQAAAQDIVSKTRTSVANPSTGNRDFTCTISSLENKGLWKDRKKNDLLVTNPDTLTDLPGIKLYDTKGFVLKDFSGSPVADPALKMALDGFQATYNFYKSAFNRNSIDDKGMEIRASIHFERGLDNAFWNPVKKQMIFGDGGRFDGR